MVLTAEVPAPVQGQEGGAANREAQGTQDTPAGHDHPAQHGGQHGRHLQRKPLNQVEIKPEGFFPPFFIY